MPAKNTIRINTNDGFYHVYNRGVGKQPIFLDDTDYAVFIKLLKRYLSPKPELHPKNGIYPNFCKEVELLAFCLMPNHFHLLLYQLNNNGISELLKSVSTSYSMYFNRKYERVGPVFQGRFRASLIHKDAYLHHISRYIHLNPKDYKNWPYSSFRYYQGDYSSNWLKTDRILELFDYDRDAYLEFVRDYEGQKAILDELKYELANR